MNVEKLIQAAEHCKNGPHWPNLPCCSCPIRRDHPECMEFNDFRRAAEGVLTVRDHYETKLKDRNSEVARFVRLFMEEAAKGGTHMNVKHLELLAEAIEKLNDSAGEDTNENQQP